MDTSSISSSTNGHSHLLNGHKSIPPETLKAVIEASLKAVGQVKAIREAVRLLSRRHQEYEKYNDERWEALNARISQLESVRPDKAPPQNGITLVNGHHQQDKDVSENVYGNEIAVKLEDEEIPTLTTFPPVHASSTLLAPEPASSPSDKSHISHSYVSHSNASPSSAVSSRQAAMSPVRQSAPRSQDRTSPAQPPHIVPDMQAGPSSPYRSTSPSPIKGMQTKPFDIIPERLSTTRRLSAAKDDDVEGYEAFIEEMEGSGKGKGKAKDSLHGYEQGSQGGLKDNRSGLRDLDVVGEENRTPATLSPTRNRGSPECIPQSSSVEDQYKAIKAEHTRLKAWERQLEKQAARQEEIKAIHLDHEEELEKRLQAVMKREDKVQRAEAVLEMRSRGSRPHEVEAAIYRRVEDARAIREECKRRAEELNEAEEAWCRAKKVDYVPVIKDGQWPFNIFPLDR